MQPEGWLSAAEILLAQDAPTEGDCRAVAHTCYYAALHMAAPYVGVDVAQNRKRHQDARERLKRRQFIMRPPQHIQKLACYFEDLHRLRVMADYDLGCLFGVDEADQALEWMRGVVGSMLR